MNQQFIAAGRGGDVGQDVFIAGNLHELLGLVAQDVNFEGAGNLQDIENREIPLLGFLAVVPLDAAVGDQ
jgi:hypothetical protein